MDGEKTRLPDNTVWYTNRVNETDRFVAETAKRVDACVGGMETLGASTIVAYAYSLLNDHKNKDRVRMVATREMEYLAGGIYQMSLDNKTEMTQLTPQDRALLLLTLEDTYSRANSYLRNRVEANVWTPYIVEEVGRFRQDISRSAACIKALGFDPDQLSMAIGERSGDKLRRFFHSKREADKPDASFLIAEDIVDLVVDGLPTPNKLSVPTTQQYTESTPQYPEPPPMAAEVNNDRDGLVDNFPFRFRQCFCELRDATLRYDDSRKPQDLLERSNVLAYELSRQYDTRLLRAKGILKEGTIDKLLFEIRKDVRKLTGGNNMPELILFREALVCLGKAENIQCEEGQNPSQLVQMFGQYIERLDDIGSKKFKKKWGEAIKPKE